MPICAMTRGHAGTPQMDHAPGKASRGIRANICLVFSVVPPSGITLTMDFHIPRWLKTACKNSGPELFGMVAERP